MKNNIFFSQFVKAYAWWENWGVNNKDNFLVSLCLLIVLMGDMCVWISASFVKAFALQKIYSEHFF